MSAFIVSIKTYQMVGNVLETLGVLSKFKISAVRSFIGMNTIDFVNHLIDMNFESVN